MHESTASLSYQDALGWEHDAVPFGTFDPDTRTILASPQLDALGVVQRDIDRLSRQAGATVPVLVEADELYTDIDWEKVIGSIVVPSERGELAFVRATGSEPMAPMPTYAQLALGAGVDEDLDVGALGWDVVHLAQSRDRAGSRTGVEVLRAHDLDGELVRLGQVPAEGRPNLVINYGHRAFEITRASRPPKGVALMAIDTDRPAVPVKGVLDGIAAGKIVDIARKPDHLLAADVDTMVGLNAITMPSVDQKWWTGTWWKKEAPTDDVAADRGLDAELTPVGVDGAAGRALVVGSALVTGTRYRLAVQIGRAYDRTVLATPPPSIDDSLPHLGPFDLEVGIFGDGLRVEGWSMQTLRLPEIGASNEVSFVVVAPEVDAPTRASLDLAVRYEGNVAQQFKLTGTVFPEGAVGEGDLRLVLTFRRVVADESAALGKRALSISTETRANGAQRLLVWGPETDHQELNAFQINNFVSGFHTILEQAFWLDGEPRWEETYPFGQPSADFESTIRQLASLGNLLAVAVLTALPSANQERMAEIADAEGKKLQVVREDGAEALPWAALYDRDLPEDAHAPVCLGRHDGLHAGGDAYCLKGFWGVRHVVEEVLRLPLRRDEPPYERPARPEAVLVSIDERNSFTEQVVAALTAASGLEIQAFDGAADQLIDRLWAADPRVAVVVLVGHVEPAPAAGYLGSGRLALRGGHYLSTGAIPARFFRAHVWTPRPGPLVMVLGCTTGPADIGAATTLVADFLKAGSPWVVGTAAAVTEEMASDVGRTLIAAVFKGASVGEAMRAWREAVLQAGNPIAFACTAVGNVDTRFAPAPSA